MARRAACSAAIWAANGVDLRELRLGSADTRRRRGPLLPALEATQQRQVCEPQLVTPFTHISRHQQVRQLGLAIGARGRSGASAHYEPNEKVINLTRNSGVGSLAHEWGHFFDHHVGGGGHEQFLSSTSDSDRESSNANPEVKAAMRGLTKSFRESGYQARLRQNLQKMVNDGLMSERMGNYYLKRIEIFARTFERFAQNELHSQGRENSYLVGLRKEGETSIYPTKDEVEKMAPHFRAVFDAFKRSKAAK